MTKQWNELKETIEELRDNGGTGTQKGICKFLMNYMNLLEKQVQAPSDSYVNRQEVVNAIANTCFWLSADNWSELMECINSVPPVTITFKQEPEWISADDYLPTKNFTVGDVLEQYLIQNEYGDMFTAIYTGNGWEEVYRVKPIKDRVVAWRPLPEQYKEQSEKRKDK